MLFGSLLLALAWSALLGEFSLGNLVAGATLGYVVLRGLQARRARRARQELPAPSSAE